MLAKCSDRQLMRNCTSRDWQQAWQPNKKGPCCQHISCSEQLSYEVSMTARGNLAVTISQSDVLTAIALGCRCFFADFLDKSDPRDRKYAEILDSQAALAAVEEALADHNATSKRPMPLAVFLYALEHVSRINRLMKQPGGNMLLVGVGGSGRQSLARLAAFMAGLELFQVTILTASGQPQAEQ
eukprot:GHRR01026074.1.p1 GENE.GHRR01026074.1~~GHRR01026074.1.p1  ORF type:complete len:184 (-),score=37.05 GHRR01026074.1:642-1193(-)